MNVYLAIILVSLVGAWLLGVVSRALNRRSLSPVLPAEFQGWYDAERYRASQQYSLAYSRLADVEETLGLVVTVGFILVGGFDWLDGLIRAWGFSEIVSGLLFFAALGLAGSLLGLPFSVYRTFVLEERFGFNRTTPRTFVMDRLKGLLLTVALGGPALAAVLWFYMAHPSTAWLWSWLAVVAFMVVLQYLAPAFIMPLFNKFEPLPQGELRSAIEEYADRQDFHLQGLFLMDGSKRSTKGNAFFTGFGKHRRIALFDTLVKEQTAPEILAVLAHEIGHYKKRHILKGLALGVLRTGVVFLLLSVFIDSPGLFAAFGMRHMSVYAGLLFFLLLYSPVSLVLDVATNWLSRKHEYEADDFAARTTSHPENLATALKKLSVSNLSNLTPHPFYVFLNYSHPPVLERVEALKRA